MRRSPAGADPETASEARPKPSSPALAGSRSLRFVAVGAVCVVAGAAVGAASRPHPVDAALSAADLGGLVPATLLLVAAFAGLAVGSTFAGPAGQPALDRSTPNDLGMRRVLRVVGPIVVVMAIALAWMLRHGRDAGDVTVPGAHPTAIPVVPAPSSGGQVWLVLAFAGVALLAAIVAAVLLRKPVAPVAPKEPREGAEAILDEGLEALLGEHDPRRAVIAAYAAMERAMARQGWARRPSEAPTEYLARVLHVARARSGDLNRLVALYEVARFSEHPVTPDMRDAALAVVQRLRADLAAVS